MVKSHGLAILCKILGWIYFSAWSVSFYPQVFLNFSRKATIGLSYDYQAYNFTGFLFYAIFSLATRLHYEHKHNNPIEINDIAFAMHAFVLTCITVFQIFYYPRTDFQAISKFATVLVGLCWVLAIYNVLLSSIFGAMPWFGGIYGTVPFFGYVKSTVTLVKYIPQVYMNWRDKSTTGWSVGNVLLDFTGGSLSLLQQFLTAYNKGDWTFVTHNVPKFLLGLESVVFDIIFIIQHYVLYGYNENRSFIIPDKSQFDALPENENNEFDYREGPADQPSKEDVSPNTGYNPGFGDSLMEANSNVVINETSTSLSQSNKGPFMTDKDG